MSLDKARERVKRGAALLDTFDPSWRASINLTTFRISNTAQCILGQHFGNYQDGLDALGIDAEGTDDDIEHGFDQDSFNDGSSFKELQKAWEELLR